MRWMAGASEAASGSRTSRAVRSSGSGGTGKAGKKRGLERDLYIMSAILRRAPCCAATPENGMNAANENVSMALFCDFENVALGVRDTKYQKFDIRPVLERLLLKGSIVVKKAYCDWERYKEFKAPMHEANFELIEIPHVRQSGKNSADIRLVVDALDLCYTKSHVNTFVIISGDSDFSPLVSKLRENDKKVIGVGVKQSTSDLLIANCDEFIFYDDLARETRRAADARRDSRAAGGAQRRTPDEERRRKEEMEARRSQAVDMVVETLDDLLAERGENGKIWASALKDALKRRRPDFNESYYGFRAFGNLLEEAQSRGLLEVGREEKSGTYVWRDAASAIEARPVHGQPDPAPAMVPAAVSQAEPQDAGRHAEAGRSGRRGRGERRKSAGDRESAPRDASRAADGAPGGLEREPAGREATGRDVGQGAGHDVGHAATGSGAGHDAPPAAPAAGPAQSAEPAPAEAAEPARKKSARKTPARTARKTARTAAQPPAAETAAPAAEAPAEAPAAAGQTEFQPQPQPETAAGKPARKRAAGGRRPRKSASSEEGA